MVQMIDATETIRVVNSSTTNSATTMAMGMGIMARAAPAPVATPLPPLPRRKIE